MELLKALKAEYGGISQAQAEKLLNIVQDLVEDLSDEVMEALVSYLSSISQFYFILIRF